ncbi:unnamed protein product, partial [marine sediment metagenome]
DEDGDFSDWIEIHNPTGAAINFGGWYLTDNAGDLRKWQFPSIQLDPDAYMVIFASDKDRTDPGSELHTNFRLNGGGEYLGLVQPNGSTVAHHYSPEFPPQTADISYGIIGPGELRYFSIPTPGAPNSESMCESPQFSRRGGTFTAAFFMELTVESPDAVIRYTLDGSPPTASSTGYVAPIAVTNTTQVRARAFETGLSPGPIVSETYILLAADVQSFTSDLPIIIVENFGAGTIPENFFQPAYMAIFDDETGRSTLMSDPDLDTRVGFKMR